MMHAQPMFVLNGNGYFEYVTGGSTYYYSRSRMLAEGTLTIDNTYWEGAASVTGDLTGRAYIELTGYRS